MKFSNNAFMVAAPAVAGMRFRLNSGQSHQRLSSITV